MNPSFSKGRLADDVLNLLANAGLRVYEVEAALRRRNRERRNGSGFVT